MSWPRGYFRLWIVLSVLYAAGAAAVATVVSSNIKPAFTAPRFEIEFNSGPVSTIDTGLDKEKSIETVRRLFSEDIGALRRSGRTAEAIDSEKRFQSLAQDAVEELRSRAKRFRDAAYRALLIAASAILLPPIILLLFGPIVGRVVAGFRQARS
jgi:hypothetical protein